jgi:hypothetical protein
MKVKLNIIFMKKIIIVLLAAFISIPALPQVFKFGIKGGMQSTDLPVYDITSGSTAIEAVKTASWGFHAGAFARIKLLAIYLQPEVVFTTNTFDYNVTENAVETLKEQKFSRLSVPLLVGVKLGPVRINAGPAAAIQIGSPEALVNDPDFENLYAGAVWGFQAGLGVDLLKRLTIDARYAGPFSSEVFGETIAIGSQTFKLDQGVPSWIISLGIFF